MRESTPTMNESETGGGGMKVCLYMNDWYGDEQDSEPVDDIGSHSRLEEPYMAWHDIGACMTRGGW